MLTVSSLLQNREPKPEFAVDIIMKKNAHIFRMNEKIENDIIFSRKMFDDSLNELRRKNKKNYKFIVNGGTDFLDALFELCLNVWNTERKPDQWRNTTIVQIYKGIF